MGSEGDSEDFEAFFVRHYPTVVQSVWGYCGDRGVAEDAAQTAFARASRDWGRVAEMASPGGWLHRVAMNEVNSHFRRMRARRRAYVRHGSRTVETGPDVSTALAVRDAMRRLPQRQRAVLALYYFADLPVAEIAEIIDAPEGTTKSLLSRGRTALRSQLDVLEETEEVNGVH